MFFLFFFLLLVLSVKLERIYRWNLFFVCRAYDRVPLAMIPLVLFSLNEGVLRTDSWK